MKFLKTEAITRIQVTIIACIIVVAAVGVGWYALMLKYSPTPEAIRIGVVTSYSGQMATQGYATDWAIRKAIDDYNKEGGVYVEEYGCKIPLKPFFADAKSDAEAAATAATKLVLQNKVHFLVTGGNPPPIAFPVASVGEKYKVPVIMHCGPIEAFLKAGVWRYTWTYHFLIKDVVKLWTDTTLAYANQTNKKVAIAVEGDVDGTEWYKAIVPLLKEVGLTPLELGTFPPGTTDFTVLIQEWKRQNAEIFWANCMTDSFVTLWRQCVEQGYRPKLALVGRALLDPSCAEALGGDLAEGILTEVWWHPEFPWASPPYPGSKNFAEMYEKERNSPWIMPSGAGYGLIQILVDAIRRAGTLDPDKFNEAMLQSSVITPLGPVHYTAETHVSVQPLVMGQWRKGEKGWDLSIVYSEVPEIKPTAKMEFPLPPL